MAERKLALYPCDTFFLNNRNMTTISAEKHYFDVLNVKLQVIIRLKTPY